MRISRGMLVAAIGFALPAVAQTKAAEVKAEVKTEKLWKIEVSGISG
ncbi:MAG: hypothetical protein JNK78_17890 [Planctomycetes bacterium]|nr:hypothetical protein [Planctomycetota bacterium]